MDSTRDAKTETRKSDSSGGRIGDWVLSLTGAYFDETTDESSSGYCYTVAGFVGNSFTAAILDLKWKDLLEKYDLAYFGEFLKHRDVPNQPNLPLSDREKKLKNQIKAEFVDLICNTGDFVGLSATVLLKDYYRLLGTDKSLVRKLPKLYVLCSQLCLMEAGFIMNESNRNAPPGGRSLLRPVFDSHDEYEPEFRSTFSAFCLKNTEVAKFLLPPIYETEQDYRCLQAADCLAYEARRFATGIVYQEGYRIRTAMDRLRDKCESIYVLDYETLKFLAEVQPVPDVIPIEPRITNRPTRRRKL
jgi:hypothetical protein